MWAECLRHTSVVILFDGDEGAERGRFLRDFAGDLPEAKAKFFMRSPGAVPEGSADGQDHTCSPAIEAEFLRRFHGRPDDQSGSGTLHGQTYGCEDRRMKASHLSLISHPTEITKLILEAAGQPA